MKPVAAGSHTTGLLWAIVDLGISFVAIVWITRRLKRDMAPRKR